MEAMFILIGIGFFVALGFLLLFVWAVKSGQYDDEHTPAIRILFDDAPVKPAVKPEK